MVSKILFVESAMELIPRELWSHRSVIAHCKKRRKKPWEILLDKNYHLWAMLDNNLKDIEKRGRPDILHKCLLTALDSPVVKENKMKVYAHTYDNKFLIFDNSIELPRSYHRFVGLMEQLYKNKKIVTNDGKVVIKMEERTLEDILDYLYYDKIVLLTKKGEKKSVFELANLLLKLDSPLILIGAFPRGELNEILYKVSDYKIRLYEKTLMAWTVTGYIVHVYGEALREGIKQIQLKQK